MNSSERFPGAAADDVHVIDVICMLWRYKLLISIVTLLAGAIAVCLALLATPIYRAEIIVNDARSREMGERGLLGGSLGSLASLAGLGGITSNGPGQESQAFLTSYRLAAEFIGRHDLARELGIVSQRKPSAWFAVKRLREKVLSVKRDKMTGITTVALEWTDPVTASKWANDYVALANELIRARAIAESSRNIAYLKGQVERTNVLELQRVMYDLIEMETKTLMLANGRVEYAFTVIDPAVPAEMRVSPRRALMTLTGLAIGLFLGIVLAFARNSWQQHRERANAR